MKGKMSRTREKMWGAWTGFALAALFLAGTVAGCATTQEVPVQKSSLSGFLGDYSKLTPGGKDQTSLRYINPAAQWTQYNKILLEPVTFWGGNTTKVSAADQQMLTNFLLQALYEELGKKFQLVDQPGPGVMRLQVALTDAEAATPGLRSISVVVPQARLLSTLKYAATGTYAFVGGAQAEARLTDAVSGQILGEWVDKRVGGGSVKAAAQWEWGDAENVMKEWAAKAANTLSSWTSGAVKPS